MRIGTLIVRSGIVVFWASCIILFLYAPQVLNYFFHRPTLNILVWPTSIDSQYLREFEKKTGARVNITYFENNEEVLVKLRSSKDSGYDLIMPSDYGADLLIQDGLLKKIDKSKLNFWHQIHKPLLNHYYDPNNDYTIPFFWGVYGLAIDSDYYKGILPEASWALVFDRNVAPEWVGMLDDAKENVFIASKYLFGGIDSYDPKKFQQIEDLLLTQKEWVSMYTDLRQDYLLLSQAAPVVIGVSSDMIRIIREYPHIAFVLPKEGSFVIIDSFVIPKTSKKDDLIYEFLNYIYQPEIFKQYSDKFGFFPVTKNVQHSFQEFPFSEPTFELFKRLSFFKNIIPEDVLSDFWVRLKS